VMYRASNPSGTAGQALGDFIEHAFAKQYSETPGSSLAS